MKTQPLSSQRARASHQRRSISSLHTEQLEVRVLMAADLSPQADLLEGEMTPTMVDADRAIVSRPSGELATNSGTYAGDVDSVSASIGEIIDNGDGTWSWSLDTRLINVGGYDVTITATDALMEQTSSTFRLVVHNYSEHIYALEIREIYDLNATDFTTKGDYVYFTGFSPTTGGQQLYRFDGVSTPEQVSNLPGDDYQYNPIHLTVAGDMIYYYARGTGGTFALWKTDGTPGEVEKIADLPFADISVSKLRGMAYVDGYLYLRNFPESSDVELWKVDVETGQFSLVAEIEPGAPNSRTNRIFNIDGVLYFFADGDSGSPLWRSDGTAEGTYKVEARPGVYVTSVVEYDGSLFFFINEATANSAWRIDETGVHLLIETTQEVNTFAQLYTGGDQLIYSLNKNGKTLEVWRWNATTEEMELVANLVDLGFNLTGSVQSYEGILYFRETVQSGGYIQNLWRTDGTPEGTFRLVGDSEAPGYYAYNYYSSDADFFLFIKDDVDYYEFWTIDENGTESYPVTNWTSASNNSGMRGTVPFGKRLVYGRRDPNLDSDQIYTLQTGPVVDISAPTYGLVGGIFQLDASGTYDEIDSQDDLTFAWDLDGDGQYDDASGMMPALPLTTPGQNRIGLRVTDQEGATTYATTTILVNATPTVGVDNQTVVIGEGGVASNTGVYADPPDDAVTLTASIGEIIDNMDGTWSWSNPVQDGPDEQTVTITATDSHGESDSLQFQVNIQNVAPTLTVDSAQLEVDATLSVVNAGTYGDPGEDPVLLTASLGDIIDNGDGTWNWSYASTLADVGLYDVTITATDDDGGETQVHFSLDVLALPEAALTLNDDAAATDADGEATTLPTSLTLIDEWDRFTANVWVKRPEHISGALTNVTLDLHFNSEWFQLADFAASSGVGQLEVNNTGDMLQISASQFAEEDAALDGYLLLGSFRFHPTPDGGLPNDLEDAYPQPVDPQLAITDLLVNSSDVEEQFGLQTVAPETKLQVVPFDLDDDGEVNLADLSRLIRRIGNRVTTTPESYPYDFDRNGVVGLTDLAHLIRNIGRTRDNGIPVAFPPTFEEPSASLSLVEPEPATAALTTELEGERIEWNAPPLVAVTTHDAHAEADAAFGTLGLLEDCWELPANEEEIEETIEEENAFSADSWRVRQLPDWALEAASIVDCLADEAIDILEELEEEHPRLAQALGRLKSRLEDL